MSKYPDRQQYCKVDAEGKFAGMVLGGVTPDETIDQWIAEGAFPTTHEEHGSLYSDTVRYIDGKLQPYTKPQNIIDAETLAAAKGEKLSELQSFLSSTDYEAIKYAEGQKTSEEYASTKALRQSWRDAYNEVQNAQTIEEVQEITYEKYDKTA